MINYLCLLETTLPLQRRNLMPYFNPFLGEMSCLSQPTGFPTTSSTTYLIDLHYLFTRRTAYSSKHQPMIIACILYMSRIRYPPFGKYYLPLHRSQRCYHPFRQKQIMSLIHTGKELFTFIPMCWRFKIFNCYALKEKTI